MRPVSAPELSNFPCLWKTFYPPRRLSLEKPATSRREETIREREKAKEGHGWKRVRDSQMAEWIFVSLVSSVRKR